MSLLKRLLLSVTLVIGVILIGTLGWSVLAAHQYLGAQLQSEGDNAVSALAISLSQPANQDPVTRELLMTALFDTGKFRSIAFVDLHGQTLFEREQTVQAHYRGQAPAWFVRLLPLASPQTTRVVSDGWRQVGQVRLTVGNGYAYDALWRSSTRMALLVLAAGVAWALFVVWLVRWFRGVLHREVEARLLTIGTPAGEVSQAPTRAPVQARVSELGSVVEAIQTTRERVRATAQEQGQRIEALELQLHRDPVTGLANRRFFINELHRVLSGTDGDKTVAGHLMLFRQRDLAAVNTRLGHAAADAWLATVTQGVRAVVDSSGLDAARLCARLNGSDFVVLLVGLTGPQTVALVERIRQALQSLRVTLADARGCRWACALTDYAPGDTVSAVLTRLDQALRRAESAGRSDVEFLSRHEGQAPGAVVATEGQWREVLEQALTEPTALSLQLESLACEGMGPVLQEASLTLHDGDAMLGGALFLPAAARLGLSADFDVRALRLGLAWLCAHDGEVLVVRVSLSSLLQTRFLPLVREALEATPSPAVSRLIFELDAYALLANAEEAAEFAADASSRGAGVALRRLDQSPMALAQMHGLALRYVKLGGGFAEHAIANPGMRHLLVAMLQTARDLGVTALVPTMVNSAAAALLREYGARLRADSN